MMTNPAIADQITFIYTDDLEKSVRFYEDIMSFRLWRDQGTCRIYSVSGNSYLGICQTSDTSKGRFQPGEQQNIILTLVTPDVDQWYNILQEHGVLFEKPPEINSTYHIYHCFLRDPNGYLIEIQRFLD